MHINLPLRSPKGPGDPREIWRPAYIFIIRSDKTSWMLKRRILNLTLSRGVPVKISLPDLVDDFQFAYYF